MPKVSHYNRIYFFSYAHPRYLKCLFLQTNRNNTICQKLAYFLGNLQTSWGYNSRFLRIRNAKFSGHFFHMNPNKFSNLHQCTFNYSFFKVFFIWRKFYTPNLNFYLPTKKHFLQKLTLSNTRQTKFVNFKSVLHNFAEKLLDTLIFLFMMCIIFLVHGHIQEFTKETVFCNYY